MATWASSFGDPAVHEMLGRVPSWEAYLEHLDTYIDCCTYGWMLDRDLFDRVVVIERPASECKRSFGEAWGHEKAAGVDWEGMEFRMKAFEGFHVPFHELNERLEEIHAYLELDFVFDPYFTEALSDINVQMSVDVLEDVAKVFLQNLR